MPDPRLFGPEHHANLARKAESEKRGDDAHKHWIDARRTANGHSRRQRYQDAADLCRSFADARRIIAEREAEDGKK